MSAKRRPYLIVSLAVLTFALCGSLPVGFAATHHSGLAGAEALIPPPKMHHAQSPDLDRTGVDVDLSISPLADDFRCTESGAISYITFWGSFYEDRLPQEGPGSLTLELAIHANIPAEVVAPWSVPGDLLWRRRFEPGQYRATTETDEALQGWFDPVQQAWERDNHRRVFRYEFAIDREPFVQREGTIYWLSVRWVAPPRPAYRFGWKSTPLRLQAYDDAVFMLDPPRWTELRYPDGHPWERESLDLAFVIHGGAPELEFGDAPEGERALAYPSLGVNGSFPTCKGSGPARWIEHQNHGAHLGPRVDLEAEGNGGTCPPPGCFPPWDRDECFADGDGGLMIPGAYTIDPRSTPPVEIRCSGSDGRPLGQTCQQAVWGRQIDVEVHNHMPGRAPAYVNVLIDWNQDGRWGGSSTCRGTPPVTVPEHVLVNFEVPNGFDGPLSRLSPRPFTIGPRAGFVWVRISITERPVPRDWIGDGSFEDGESEDYLLRIEGAVSPTPTPTRPVTQRYRAYLPKVLKRVYKR